MSDELWAQLADAYTDQQLLELLVIAGWYRTLAYVINAARVPAGALGGALPSGADGLTRDRIRHVCRSR